MYIANEDLFWRCFAFLVGCICTLNCHLDLGFIFLLNKNLTHDPKLLGDPTNIELIIRKHARTHTQKTAEHLFTLHSNFITHSTSHYFIFKKRFEKGIFAEIYYLFASERLLVYLLPILSHISEGMNLATKRFFCSVFT